MDYNFNELNNMIEPDSLGDIDYEKEYNDVVNQVDDRLKRDILKKSYKISSINKELKEKEYKTVQNAIFKGISCAFISYLLLVVRPDFELYNVEILRENFDSFFLPMFEKYNVFNLSDTLNSMYSSIIEAIDKVIESVGQAKLLAGSSILGAVLNVGNDSAKILKIKNDLKKLREEMEDLTKYREEFNSNRK